MGMDIIYIDRRKRAPRTRHTTPSGQICVLAISAANSPAVGVCVHVLYTVHTHTQAHCRRPAHDTKHVIYVVHCVYIEKRRTLWLRAGAAMSVERWVFHLCRNSKAMVCTYK